jgi:hypothetical protein
MVGSIPESSPTPASLIPSSLPTSGPDIVFSPMVALDSVPSVSLHSANILAAETLPIPITISSPPAIAPILSPRLSPETALVPAPPALDDEADPAPYEPVVEHSAARPASKLEQWWLAHRKDIVSGVQTVLELTSKALDDIPVGGSIAAKALELGASTLERVQVMLAHR